MNNIELLFPIPVGIFDIGNQSFSTAVTNTKGIPDNSNNIWACNSQPLDILRNKFIECANEVVKYCPAYSYSDTSIDVSRGWIQTCKFGEFHLPHNHSSSLLVGVYYVQAEGDCGDLILQDPSASSMWSNYLEGNQDCRVWKRIKPKTGRLVIFPGHIIHSTDTNKTNIDRIAIATNFNVNFRRG